MSFKGFFRQLRKPRPKDARSDVSPTDKLQVSTGAAPFWSITLFAVVLVFVVGGIYVRHFGWLPLSDQTGTWGQFGDYLGGTLNPSLSFLTLMVVLFTMRLQHKELALGVKAQANNLKVAQKQADYATVSARIQALQVASGVLDQHIAAARMELSLDGDARHQQLVQQSANFEQRIFDALDDLEKLDEQYFPKGIMTPEEEALD